MKLRKHQSFWCRGRICITNINNRDFYVLQDISLKENIEILTLIIQCCPVATLNVKITLNVKNFTLRVND